METINLLNAEFKTLFMRMLGKLSENFNTMKKNQSEIKITLSKMRTNL